MNARTCLLLAALLGFLGVGLGAFGAHGLADREFLQHKYADLPAKVVAGHELPAGYKYFQDYQTAVRYHMWHCLALLAVGILLKAEQPKALRSAAWCFLLGILLFSGSLYLLVMAGPRWGGIPWGAVTPIGGSLLLAGWVCLAVFARSTTAVTASAERQVGPLQRSAVLRKTAT